LEVRCVFSETALVWGAVTAFAVNGAAYGEYGERAEEGGSKSRSSSPVSR
jgi:hypothetical protein